MKILVTGGTGFIGSHTVVELQNEGFEVVIIDNLSNSDRTVVDSIAEITNQVPVFEELDLVDRAATFACIEKHKDIVGVIHFAALKAVGESVEKPLLYYYNNLTSLINLLLAMQKFDLQNFVFSSSCTVYGQPDQLPVGEQAPLKKAESPYGNTKKISEDIIRDSVGAGSMNAISLRYFNPIGAHDTALIGELPLGVPDNLVPYITQTAIGKRDHLKVFGKDYSTHDGTAIRDYIHVVDLARAHVVAVKRMLQGNSKIPFEIFNLGTGNGFTVLEVIKAFEKVSGEKLNYEFTGRRKGDIEKVWADTSFANQELGWKAALGLEEMMLSAWNWELALSNRYT
ncbi:MAG: UDP-glucose 4-epimerase GalE [Bacteroidota bacterium]|nr:UDP-glucose 4-epimerase GalE [Bacteroidota bacterium]